MDYFENPQIKKVMKLLKKANKLETQSKIKKVQPCSNGCISYYENAVYRLRVYDPYQNVQISSFFQDMESRRSNPYFVGQNQQWLYKTCDGLNSTYIIKNDIQEMKFHIGCFFGYIGNYLISYERLQTKDDRTKIIKQDTSGHIIKQHIIQEQPYSNFQSLGKMYIVYSWNQLHIQLFNDRSIKHLFKDIKPLFSILYVKSNQIMLTSKRSKMILSIKRMNKGCKLIRRIKVQEHLRFQKQINLIILKNKPQNLIYIFNFSKHRLVLLSSVYIKSVGLTNDQKYLFFSKKRNLYTIEIDRVLKQLIY